MEKQNRQTSLKKYLYTALLFLIIGIAGIAYLLTKSEIKPPLPSKEIGFKKFASEEEFAEYLKKAEEVVFWGAMPGVSLDRAQLMAPEIGVAPEAGLKEAAPAAAPERVSETTVQVKGIDEPDIVKTDGEQIYFSSDQPVYRPMPAPRPLPESGITEEMDRLIPPLYPAETKIIKAFPPANLAKKAEIDKIGELLLFQKMLIIFSKDNKIFGFDVSDPTNPTQKWDIELQQNNYLAATRLYQGKIYFITQTQVNTYKPCPIVPLKVGGQEISIKCLDVYHPIVEIPVDVTFTTFVLNPENGQIEKSVSFVGSSSQSIVFMSKNALYATYTYFEDMLNFFYKFFSENKDLVPNELLEKIAKIKDYEISNQAKMVEYQQILEQYYASLSDDERLRIQNEVNNRMADYAKKQFREVEKTGLVKIGLDYFEILSTGTIPGQPLNQFSLDEYQENLRIATTIGGRFLGTRTESANDVYVLNKDLKILGQVQNLALGERIFSARFIEDKGYLVTFKQIDPFFVLDLSDPKNPAVKGELKIPGYSSYLHPITSDKILGIGKEEPKVKISLFDVSNPANPNEAAKYTLDEYWSDILNTHHAFLLDTKHEVFFLPGSKGGYVFSYKGDDLKLEKAVSDIQARRAIYLDDYLYIIGDNKIIVLSETNWQKINQLEF